MSHNPIIRSFYFSNESDSLKTFFEWYEERKKTKFKAFEAAKKAENLKERLKILVNFNDKAGEFYRNTFYDSFRYCSFRIPEVADEIYKIDQAIKGQTTGLLKVVAQITLI